MARNGWMKSRWAAGALGFVLGGVVFLIFWGPLYERVVEPIFNPDMAETRERLKRISADIKAYDAGETEEHPLDKLK